MSRTLRGGLLALALAVPAAGQISPGPLAAPHAGLEGSRSCLACHRAGEGVDAELCFACHRALAERVGARQGLHARDEHRRCERCHSEHNGREFALVFWPEGEAAFDHALAGWRLEGRHARLGCRECHRAERVSGRVRELEPAKDPARTFLGLGTACVACHADPHRGTMKGDSCAACHSQESWKAARGFDHAATRFPLAGAHARAECVACHAQPVAPEPGTPRVFDQFRGRASLPACADCHRDPHAGRLGADCSRCHSVDRFRGAERARFDHDRTAYPLRGRHRQVECARCHAPGLELRIPGYGACVTCHRDPHAGQLAAGGAPTDCEACHGVEGFLPARYGFEEHERARFPLAGAHRAVPCVACHVETTAAELPPPFRGARSIRTRRFRFTGVACADCHRDPHAGELDRYAEPAGPAGRDGCAACHDQERWRPARFDHRRSRFPLDGAHARVACDRCHPPAEGTERRFAGRPLDCAGCHRDVHAGQLAAGGVTDCARCHSLERFRPAPGFDHARSRFPLDGRHVKVACAACHPTEAGDPPVVRYKPRPLDCAGCHAAGARR